MSLVPSVIQFDLEYDDGSECCTVSCDGNEVEIKQSDHTVSLSLIDATWLISAIMGALKPYPDPEADAEEPDDNEPDTVVQTGMGQMPRLANDG